VRETVSVKKLNFKFNNIKYLIILLTMSNTERYRGHRRVISSVSEQMATDSDVFRYYDLKVKLSFYPHMRNVWFNGVEQCPATQLMNSFHTFHTCGNNEAIRKQVKQELPELEERFRIHQIELNKKLEIEKQIQNDRLNAFILECKTYRINPKNCNGYKGHDQLVIELEQAKAAEKRREMRKQALGLKHNSKENETREFEIRFQKEEKEKRYQEFKRKKEKSKCTEAIPIAVAVPLLVVENVA
jgi:hypothetical protein